MKFHCFTYFLNPIKQQILFENKKDKNTIFKELVVNKKFEFKDGNSDLVFICNKSFDNFAFAKLGKKSKIKKNLLSENDFEEIYETDYPNCILFFKFNSDSSEGQKIFFQYDSKVFRTPENKLKIFEQKINEELFSFGYSLSINPIVDEKDFWKLNEKYAGKIEKITFCYAVPNLFNIENELNEDLKSGAKKYNNTNAAITFENKSGGIVLSKDDIFVKQSVEYITKGGGEFRLKARGLKGEINSGKKVKVVSIEEIELETDNIDFLTKYATRLFK